MEPLDFFDCNCMIGKVSKPPPSHFATKERLLEEMDYLCIREAAVFHTLARDYSPWVGNAELMTEIEGEERLHGCWVFPLHPDPGTKPQDMVNEMLARGVKVARLFPPYSNGYVVSPLACGGLFEALAVHRIPVLLTGSDLGRHPAVTPQKEPTAFSVQNICDLCETYPRMPIIIVRFNYQNLRIIFPMLERFPNLYLEISYFTAHRGIELLCKSWGAERILFGTGMPVNHPAVALMLVRYARISDEEKQMVAAHNFRRLLSEVC